MSIQYFNAFSYKQNKRNYFSLILPFGILKNITKTLEYNRGGDPYGYQRHLNEKHYLKIASRLKKNPDDNVSPNSIILGINRDELSNIIEPVNNFISNLYKIKIDTNLNIFRTVDGQHRLKGLEIASQENLLINDYELNVIILVVDRENRYEEVKAFVDINSLAKPVKTDLTILAKFNYEILEKKSGVNPVIHIAVKTIFHLNDYLEKSVWNNAIKTEVNDLRSLGIIGFKTFLESISPLITLYLKEKQVPDQCEHLEFINFTDETAIELAEKYINPCWDIIKEKWVACFTEKRVYYNKEEARVFYDEHYYIQKTMGAKALNKIIIKFYEKYGFTDNAIENFKCIIQESPVLERHWEVGEYFSGLSSEAGIEKIRQYVCNEKSLDWALNISDENESRPD
jgi:DGQHR domain-containing protein